MTFYTYTYEFLATCDSYISLEVESKRNDMGTATLVLKADDPCVQIAMQCTTTVVPVVIQLNNIRWSGRVNSYSNALNNRLRTCTIELIDDFAWFSRMLVWPNFELPIEIQVPSNAVYVGPAISCVLTMIAEQAFRLQSGIWNFINDPIVSVLSLPVAWQDFLQRWNMAGGNLLQYLAAPICVMFQNPIFDTSPWVALTGRMDKIYDLIKDTLMDYGLALQINLWLPGDPQPGTEALMASMLPLVTELTGPTLVVTCVDRRGVTGPTGTFIDGLVEDVVDLEHSLLGNTLSPFLNPNNEYYPANLGINIAPTLGVNFVPSWVLFNGDDPKFSGLDSFKLTGYHPLAHTVVGGGKSPKWLDDLINATLEFLIDAIEITVGFTGIPDTLLNGTFDDILLAFQEQINYERRLQLGPFGFPEYFMKTGASAYTLDEWFALMQGMFDSQGYTCIQLTWQDGRPYEIGRDVFLGGLVSFVLDGLLYTDYVYSFKIKDDRKTRALVEIVVGDGKREVNPILRVVRMLTGLEQVVNVVTMSPAGN
ncbi:hypothetical protein [Mycobacterium colombiense]|uniref:Gp37-like protein n=1 Tax=Mycobacterium colombiense TaxID=339268 RepID=UPI00197CA042|nr:hypothetical protein [Mycobacterium colombiense]